MGSLNGMSTLFKKLTQLANSPQGKKLAGRAQEFANDPKTKAQVEKAKLKLAEMRAGRPLGRNLVALGWLQCPCADYSR